MMLLRLAIETRKWDLAAHVIILGAIAARLKYDRPCGEKKRGRTPRRARQG
jgi:hypothetical protein